MADKYKYVGSSLYRDGGSVQYGDILEDVTEAELEAFGDVLQPVDEQESEETICGAEMSDGDICQRPADDCPYH